MCRGAGGIPLLSGTIPEPSSAFRYLPWPILAKRMMYICVYILSSVGVVRDVSVSL